jgi:hypothetical protein
VFEKVVLGKPKPSGEARDRLTFHFTDGSVLVPPCERDFTHPELDALAVAVGLSVALARDRATHLRRTTA